jgi:hypothetical protein
MDDRNLKIIMKFFTTFAVSLGLAGLSVGSCLADISAVSATGATATTTTQLLTDFTGFTGNPYPTAIIGDTLTSLSSQITFTYSPPPDYGAGDRLVLLVTNHTGSTLSDIVFTLAGSSNPEFYDRGLLIPPLTPEIPSAGIYTGPPTALSSGTYTTVTGLEGDLNAGLTVLNVPLSLPSGQTQDFYFAVNYTGTPGSFTLTQAATPEPGFYGILALGLSGLVAFARRRKSA